MMAQEYLRSSDPNTLKGYDLVITVSQDAINKQFKSLYETEIPQKVMPLPEGMEGHQDAPAAKYYINHNLTIRPVTFEKWDDETMEPFRPEERPEDGIFLLKSVNWIEGEIDAPYVTLGEEDPVDNRCVRVHLKFKEGILHYNLNGHMVEYKLAGCVLSWLVDLSHKQVGDVLENIIKPSRDKTQPTLVSEPILKKLEAVKNENYTITTLFCLFESARISRSFRFINKGGLNQRGSAAANEAGNLISSYFAALSEKGGVGSTPNNPFVLGYGLTQAVGDETEEQRRRSEHVPYMVPKSFDLTVTPGDKHYSNGVLNYCILTHRRAGEEATVLDHQGDANAGIWRAGDTPYSRIRANGMTGGADGVISISRGVFRDFWLKEKFLEYFKVNFNELRKTLVPQNDNVAQPPDFGTMDLYEVGAKQVNQLTIKQLFEFSKMPCQDMDTAKMEATEDLNTAIKVILEVFKNIGLEISYRQQRLATGYAEASLVYSSDVQKNPDLGKGLDVAESRKIYFDVELKSNVVITQQAAGICNIHRLKENGWRNGLWLTYPSAFYEIKTNFDFYKRIFTEWRNARQAKIDISAKVGMDLSPAGDTWTLELLKNDPRTTIPFGEEEMPRHVFPPRECSTIENIFGSIESSGSLVPPERKDDGVYIELSNHEIFKQFGTSKGMDEFAAPAQQWASEFEKTIEGHMAALAGGLASKLILPAGEIYEFQSLNTDENGHVYSLLSYKTSTEVSQTKEA